MNIYLYVKTHNKTGMKYLGKTCKENVHEYPGSGKRWLRHLNKHGYDYSTEILFSTDDPELFKEKALEYSNYFNVVDSNEWANLMEESGTGGDNSHNIDYQSLVYTRMSNGKTWVQTPESNQKRSNSMKGRPKSRETVEKWLKTKDEKGILHSPTWNKESNPEACKKVSDALSGVSKSQSHIDNMQFHENNKPIHECPHCGKVGDLRNMKRWHFDRCKHNPNRSNDLDKTVTCYHCGHTAKQSPNFYKYHNDNCNYL